MATTPAQRREAWILFALLLPCYLWLLPRPGASRWAGFLAIAVLGGYMLFLSPHLRRDAASRLSLLEVPLVLGVTLLSLWGVLPRSAWGLRLGIGLLTTTAGYMLVVSPRLHGDTPEDWGLGSPARNVAWIKGPEGRGALLGLVLANAAVVALFLLASTIPAEIFRGVLRRMLGIKSEVAVPPALLALIALATVNAMLLGVLRYDNLGKAGRIVGLYLLGVSALLLGGGYWYVYVHGGGWVEFRLVKGLSGVGSYFLWGTLQELLFLGYFNTRIRKGMDSPPLAALLTAVVFSLHHLPAYALTLLCFLVGIVWARIFQAAPNLLALGLGHGFSGGVTAVFSIHGMIPLRIKASVGPFSGP